MEAGAGTWFPAFVELTNSDFVKQAESYGAKGYRIEAAVRIARGPGRYWLDLRGVKYLQIEEDR